MTTDLTFGTWNVQTMLQPGKMMEIADEVLKLGTDLVALQEIRWQGHGEINKKNFTVIRIQWLGHLERMQDTAIPKEDVERKAVCSKTKWKTKCEMAG
jgi:hypothetical protein